MRAHYDKLKGIVTTIAVTLLISGQVLAQDADDSIRRISLEPVLNFPETREILV